SVVEGLSSFLQLFDQPEVADVFCPPPRGEERPGAPRVLPPMDSLIEDGRVLALNMAAGESPALGKVLGVMLKGAWLQALLRRPKAMADPANSRRSWRPAVLVIDEYHTFATVGGDDPSGDERTFALSRQSRLVPLLATQSLSSLRSAVGNREAWRTLLQTLRTRIFLSLSDEFSAEQASKLCGQAEILRPNYSFSESAGRAGVSLLSGRAGGSRGSLSASRSYSTRLEAKFKPRDFAELDNAQAIAQAYDGVRTLPASRLYLKPHYLPADKSWFRQAEEGLL
ncbi:MAG: TraM recognition domain-containing protein, partial [bacterium]|nr:TraM recognition domain-containing protein [bacterium]